MSQEDIDTVKSDPKHVITEPIQVDLKIPPKQINFEYLVHLFGKSTEHTDKDIEASFQEYGIKKSFIPRFKDILSGKESFEPKVLNKDMSIKVQE